MIQTHDRMVLAGIKKMAEWAAEHVEGETAIPETAPESLDADEVAALALMGAILARPFGGAR